MFKHRTVASKKLSSGTLFECMAGVEYSRGGLGQSACMVITKARLGTLCAKTYSNMHIRHMRLKI